MLKRNLYTMKVMKIDPLLASLVPVSIWFLFYISIYFDSITYLHATLSMFLKINVVNWPPKITPHLSTTATIVTKIGPLMERVHFQPF